MNYSHFLPTFLIGIASSLAAMLIWELLSDRR